MQTTPDSCGKTGIRTLEPLWTVTRFPDVPLQPLEHLSFGMAKLGKKTIFANVKRTIVLNFLFFATMMTADAAPVKYEAVAVKSYPHDTGSYTQGLFFHGKKFYESTGQYGSSTMREVDLESGKALKKIKFGGKYFAEGSVILGSKLYILTWTNKVAFVYDATSFAYEKAYSYPREGWGLTTDGKRLVASDGSSRIYFLDAEFKQLSSIDVKLNGRPVRNLNELEWIDGRIWANVYLTDMIVIINPESGEVEATVDCRHLFPVETRPEGTDVLNGIALAPDGRIYLTGKLWPRLYEIKLKEKK